ncbi:MAG: hypothetical protein SCK57_03815 [Bacillota bacterium]|nr:hypothetical protein [Bacillota bacterium]MDW7676766.1 hypothetical protein [Bacillota bacterium]
MALDHTVVKRLAFVKYLYQTAVAQSQAPSPLSCASLLTMHDAVELFLQLASEHLNAGSGHPSFMDYWDILSKKMNEKELEQKESMRRLNKARVALKHHGTFPSDLDIESFRASGTAFFKDNTQLIFGCSLDDISLIEFVNPESARNKLEEALGLIKKGDTLTALDLIALAFTEMITDYENRKRGQYQSSPFFFGSSMSFLNSFHMGLEGGSFSSSERKLGEFIDKVSESIKAMQDAIKMLALGIDYRKYSRFRMLTPHLTQIMGGEWRVHRRFKEIDKPSEEDARFCLDFSIESALALAEFDYTVSVSK